MNKTVTFMAGLVTVWIVGYLLIAGRSLLIPLVIALFIWYLLNTLVNSMQYIPFIKNRCPIWLSRVFAVFVFVLLVRVVVTIISDNVNQVIAASSRYQENLMHLLSQIDSYFNIKLLANLDSLIANISFRGFIVNVYDVFTTLMGSAILITLYVVFMFVEQHYFNEKMSFLFSKPQSRALVNNIMSHIVKDTQTYLGLKTLLSLITAIASWIIMKVVGLDFAAFWALLIFFLNFIPNIGAMVATAFPSVLALIQFSSWWPFVFVSSGIVAVQFIIGNIIEPKFLSKSLNVSPLVILIALAFWGSLWGILGMFLSVPITVMMMIVFAHFDATRPLAVMLSQDGQIQKAYEQLS